MRRGVWGASVALVLLGIYVACPFRLGIVCGSSMEPTFHNGQPIVIDRGYYRDHPVRRGDVVLLNVRGDILIKRVFACGGDSFHVCVCPDEEGISRFVIDERLLPRVERVCWQIPGERLSQVRIQPGYVYVLGDNSNVSVDSREFGAVPLDQIIGHVAVPSQEAPGIQSGVRLTARGRETLLARRPGS